jgi:hypothetical protein
MDATSVNTSPEPDVDPERVGLIWMDAERAMIARWRGEPVVERVESGVPPKRPAVGSVRRGPGRPAGGGRVPGHGTEGRHLELSRRYLADLAGRLADLDVVEVAGRAMVHEQFAALLRRLAARGNGVVDVTTRRASRRPTERQLAARLREMLGAQHPRRTVGSYRWTGPQATAASGRILPPDRGGRRNPKPRHLPERREIELEVEMMLADDAPAL